MGKWKRVSFAIHDANDTNRVVDMNNRGIAASQQARSLLLPKVFERHEGEEARDALRRQLGQVLASQMCTSIALLYPGRRGANYKEN